MNNAAAPIRYKRPKSDPKSWAWAYGLIAPTIIGLCILNIYPFFYTIYLSTLKYKGLGKPKFIGLENYVSLINDPKLGQFTWNTLYFVILTVPVGIFIALILAALLNNNIRGRDVYRGIYFLPMVVAPAAVAMVWKWIFNADNGVLNLVLSLVGIKGPTWLSNPNTALLSCAIINIWSAVGYDLVMILAGLQSISKSYYEAAQIDGASSVQTFFHITIPLISPTLFFVVMMRTMSSLKQFDTVYLLIKSQNPAYNKGMTLMTWFYREAFEKFDKGFGSVIVLYSFLLISIFTLIQFVCEKKLVHYE